MGHYFVSTMGLFSIIRFKIRVLTSTKFVEFPKGSTFKASWNAFFKFSNPKIRWFGTVARFGTICAI